MTPRPFTLIAELCHRCPLACPYCSNPTDFAQSSAELGATVWGRVFVEAEALGVVQVHLTGGEPLLRDDLEEIVAFARQAGLYTNLVTSGIPLSRERWQALAKIGVDHVQLSLQAADAEAADRIAGRRSFQEKLESLAFVRETGTPLTLNVVLHRENIDELEAILALAVRFAIPRLELAHAQYQGFALKNRDALLPSSASIERARRVVREARAALGRRMQITHVLPDYHAGRPKACMDGWARRYIHVAPDGVALPCHAARSIPGLSHDNVSSRSLAWLWHESPAFNAFRGHDWMKEPCRSCDQRDVDFGGCRCQAFALTGDAAATDPACSLASEHRLVLGAREAASAGDRAPEPRYLHRAPRTEVPRRAVR